MNSLLSMTLGIGVLTLVSLLLTTSQAKAETLDAHLFSAPIPPGNNVSRNVSGLWEIFSAEPFEQRTTLLLSRLLVKPETYLQGTSQLWQSLGRVEFVAGPEKYKQNMAHFLIHPSEDTGELTSKHVVWTQDRLLVVSSTFPVKHSEQALEFATSFTKNIVIKDVSYDPEALKRFVLKGLSGHQNTQEELAELSAVRREMASFRQDWEPIVPVDSRTMFGAYQKYLEARYDSAFVVARGEELGMPASVLEARMKSLSIRKSELMGIVEGRDSGQGL